MENQWQDFPFDAADPRSGSISNTPRGESTDQLDRSLSQTPGGLPSGLSQAFTIAYTAHNGWARSRWYCQALTLCCQFRKADTQRVRHHPELESPLRSEGYGGRQ